MDAEEFTSVRDLFRSFADRFQTSPATLDPAARSAAQKGLGELGLVDLRRASPPAATVQECALLAEEHGKQPLPTSFLGTVLLAPELLRLLGTTQETDESPTSTIALAAGLGRPGRTGADLVAWDCASADEALCVMPDGTVTAVLPGPAAPTADLLRETRRITPGSPSRVLGRLDPDARVRWQAYALLMVGSEMVGTAAAVVGQAVGYARERRQYGREIGSFQAVQHLLADATVLVAACTSATRYAAWCLDHQEPARALKAARVAKAETNASAVEAVYAAAQIFGGIAQTWEHNTHFYLRKVLSGATVLETTADLLSAVAETEDAA